MFGDLDKNTKQFPNRKLNEISAYWNGLTYKPADAVEAGSGTLVLRSSNIQDGSLAFDDNVYVGCTIKEKLFVQDNDILMCSRNGSAALVGKTALIKGLTEPTTFGAFMMIIRSDYYSYLKTYFETPFFRNKISTGTSTINQITGKMLNEISLPVPDMDTVRRFEEFTHQSDKSKFVRFKSQFIEMFGLPERNTHEYEIGTIGDVVKDVHYGTAKKASEDGRYIYIRMNNITYDGDLDLTDIKRIDVPEKDLSGCMVQEGDVLFNRTNSKDLVGKTCHFTGDEPMIIAGYIIRLRMNGKVLPEYVSTFMNLDRSKKLLYSMAKGAVGQANINAKEVQSIPIVIPPENLQQEFLKLRKQSDKSK
ncbi:restriction endonuclease subunit S [Mogibacterium kristiansenii]|uniref:restriction endonuclease subunit S n=1 Tax=Mogibacterium kristiansenii TaxID=2606708 RepID=UPI00240A0C17|nr:restriction endonuclease subunit S [Mogibacterium kristiansenii]MDD6699479.1 restriction endonuclease subunit S [Mogibacterium kristiansenii]